MKFSDDLLNFSLVFQFVNELVALLWCTIDDFDILNIADSIQVCVTSWIIEFLIESNFWLPILKVKWCTLLPPMSSSILKIAFLLIIVINAFAYSIYLRLETARITVEKIDYNFFFNCGELIFFK